nr:MAG TPA: Intradiol ring-cleavage dioxygenase center, intradiol dioxygenase, carbohydrate [Caudoviricetes sp.]
MKYAIVDIVWCESHGIEVLPEMRISTDQSKVILHEEYLAPFDDEDFPRYSFSDPSFVELLNSEEWTYPEGEQPVINRQFSRLLALDELNKEAIEEINTYDLSPSEALQVKDRYPEWETGINVKTDERYRVEDVLWECVKDHLTQDNWKPSMATASLWKVVDEEHKGTIDDPIVYIPPMEIFKDKYYIQNGIKYKCTRNSEQPLTHDLSALVGLYVEKV